jgi:putative hydrolase of the HAD superfamily
VTQSRFRAVLFDYGGVFTETPGAFLKSLAEACGAEPLELIAFLVGPYGEDGDHPWHRLERGEITFEALCGWARDEGTRRGWRLDLALLPELVRGLTVRREVVECVLALRKRGYKTAIVTNNVREFGFRSSWRHATPLEDLFDAVVDSCEVGFRKPDPRIYRLALERLGGVAPEEAVLLDDFEVNVTGARALGMHAILVGADWRAAFEELDALLSG